MSFFNVGVMLIVVVDYVDTIKLLDDSIFILIACF